MFLVGWAFFFVDVPSMEHGTTRAIVDAFRVRWDGGILLQRGTLFAAVILLGTCLPPIYMVIVRLFGGASLFLLFARPTVVQTSVTACCMRLCSTIFTVKRMKRSFCHGQLFRPPFSFD